MKKSYQLIVAAMFATGLCGTAVAETVECGAKACLTTADGAAFEASLKCKSEMDEFGVSTGWTAGSLVVGETLFTLEGSSTSGETCAISGDAFGSGKTEVKCVDASGYKVEAEIKATAACDMDEVENEEEIDAL